MKEMEIKQQNLNKMFDIVNSKDSDPTIKVEIVKFLSRTSSQNIIEPSKKLSHSIKHKHSSKESSEQS